MAEPLLSGSVDKAKPFEGLLNKRLSEIKAYGEATKDWPTDLRQLTMLTMPGFLAAEPIPWEGEGGQKDRFNYQMSKLEEAALKKAAMNEKANDRALFNTMISKFGDNIARGLGGPSWDTIERNRATGLTAINNINPSTLQPLTTAQFQSRNYYS
jgi:hypothetical protein